MKKTIMMASSLLVASVAAILGGCNDGVQNGTVLYYQLDQQSPSEADASIQTMAQDTVQADADVEKFAKAYDALAEQKRQQAAEAAMKRAQAMAEAAKPKLAAPLASDADIAAAKVRIDELRGSYTTAKNGAITAIVAETSDLNVDDMKLFGRLGDLESFSCLGSHINDEYFAEFKDLKKLKNIRVQNADITGETLKLFATFPELESLDIRRDLKLENNDLAVIAEFPKLVKLAAYYNSFTNSGVNKISKSKTLKVVDVRGCTDVSDTSAKFLARMETLEEVYFRFLITDDGVENLAAAPNLKFVELQDCPITNACVDGLAKCQALTGLRIFRSKGFTDDGIKGLANLKLERLELRDLSATDEGVIALKDMDTLKTVELSEMQVNADTINTLVSAPGWSGVTSLSFFSIGLSDEVAASIASNMKDLKSVTFRAAGPVSDAMLEELCKIDSLTTIDLRDNAGFTVDGFMKLSSLKNLRKIYVKGTKFGDSSDEVHQKWEEFKKANPKCTISIDG